ncbi:MAG: SDR family oxidoreductase [Planctomycetes bacterium]|nr:SDR family oxidoreductase [Planctomycetota bacterium]
MGRVLTDQVIIITGASSGIGAATAIQCAKAGMDVVLNARRADRLEQVAAQICELGRHAKIVVGSVTDEGMTEQMLDVAQDAFGRFDVVFANAGYGFERSVVQMDDQELRQIFDVNFFASFDLIREAAKRLISDERPGHLLMCSSCLAKFTLPFFSAYSATKAAQNHFCRAMRLELARYNIEVSSVHPITTTTEFFEVSNQLSGKADKTSTVPDHASKMFVQTPERVARAIVRCLGKPRPEVWTSHIVRSVAGVMTAFPWFFDLVVRKQAKGRRDL